ncbi:GNAT family N-acetyltransferase [Leucobacter musarum]|uniref:GNAT family N-acetyltransferase n=1 Tax=Leucobacter musarum TaxID=1930747 RepID=UPI0006A7EAAC|nr:GNAT family N-acetyltransferase [Leucobacter musarum]
MIRHLERHDLATPAFRALLWLACEADADELDRIIRAELPELQVLGWYAGGELTGFAAYHDAPERATLEYIAVAESAQGRGVGRSLIAHVAESVSSASIVAETDDDAVAFYRRLGFDVQPLLEIDPRWPQRRRYRCTRSTNLSRARGKQA